MAPDGLEKLKEIRMEIENLRNKVFLLMADMHELCTIKEDVEDRNVHKMLTNGVSAMEWIVRAADRAIAEMKGAYKSEKALMDFSEELLGNVNNSVKKAGVGRAMNNNDTELNAEQIRKAGYRVLELCKADESFRHGLIDMQLTALYRKPMIDLYALKDMCKHYGMSEDESMEEFLSRRIGDEDKMNELRELLNV